MRRLPEILWSMASALAMSATLASAHAVLTKASVNDAPVKVETATPVMLTFNAGIEPKFTQVVLRGEGSDRPLTARAGGKASEVVVDLPPLPPGAYALRYKVLAADGHVTESVLRFKVGAE
jgi:methionine-rich copper-binding protein CopC